MIQTYNIDFFLLLNAIGETYPAIEKIIIFLSDHFGYALLFALIVFVLSYEQTGEALRVLMVMAFAGALAWGASYCIKYFFPFERPFDVLSEAKLFVPAPLDATFPSGHASFYGAIAGAALSYYGRLGVLLFLGALLIGISRIMVGVHFPLDILVGLLGGALFGYFFFFFFRD